jgi:hypothetical protein
LLETEHIFGNYYIQKKLSRIDLPFTEFAVRTLSRTADLPASIDEVSHGDAAAMIEFGHDSSWRRGHAAPYPCSEMVSNCWRNCHYCVYPELFMKKSIELLIDQDIN